MDNIAINQILLLLLQCVIVGGLLLFLFRLRSVFGLSLVYITLGVFQYLQVFLANAIFFEVAPGIYASPGSMVLFTASLFAILIVYIREDALETRKIIYAIIAINIILSFLQLIFSWSIEGEGVVNIYKLPKEFFLSNARIVIGGTLALAIDTFLVIYFYEKASKIFKALFLRMFFSMAIVLIVDSLLFSIISFFGTPQFYTVLLSGFVTKVFASIIYSILFTIYLLYFEKGYLASEKSEHLYSDVFNALTFRQKYEQVIEENISKEIELQKSELKTKSILLAMDDLVFVLDEENRFVAYYANQQTLYLSENKFLGKTLAETMPANINQSFELALKEVKNGKVTDFEYYMEVPNGKEWFSVRLSPIMEGAKYAGLTAVSRDITKNKIAAEEIKTSELKFRSIFDGSTDGIMLLDSSNNVIEVNDKACEILEYSKEEMLKMNASLLLHPDDIEEKEHEKTMRKLMNGETVNVHYRLRKNSGLYIFTELSTKRIEGNMFLNIFRDITERKIASEAIQKSEARLTEAQKIAKIGSWELDLVTNNLSWSDEVYRIFDLKPQQFKATYEAFLDNIHPDDRERVNQAYTASVKNKTQYSIEHRLILKDGSIKYVKEYGKTFYNDNGQAIRSFGTVQDLTKLKEAETQKEELLQRFENINTHIPGAIYQFCLRPDGTVFVPYASKGFKELYGVNAEDVKKDASTLFNVVHPEDIERASKSISESAKNLSPWHSVTRHLFPDGKMIWVEGNSTPQKLKDGSILWHGYIRDITDRIQSEIVLHESQVFNQTLLNTSPDLIYIYDILENKNIYSNAGITKILAYTVDEIQALDEKILAVLMHPDDFKHYLNVIFPQYQTIEDEEIIEHDYRMKHKDGTWRWLNSRESIFMRQEDGKPKQIFGLTSDITVRKEQAEEIKQINITLEQKVEERTQELAKQNKRLEKLNKVFVGRENRMAELKKEIEKLKNTSTGPAKKS